jgi:hypothetical protein
VPVGSLLHDAQKDCVRVTDTERRQRVCVCVCVCVCKREKGRERQKGRERYEHIGSDMGRYKIGSTLPQRVGRLNPYWNEHGVNTDERFAKAMQMAGDEFESVLNNYAKSWMPARTIVKQALDKRLEVPASLLATHLSGMRVF